MIRKSRSKCISNCKVYTAYIRIKHQWCKVGQYHTLCGKFSRIVVEKEDRSNSPEIKHDDGLSEEIKYMKNLSSVPSTITKVSDDELSELCSSIV